MRIKPGVKLHSRYAIPIASQIASDVYKSHGAELVITSGIDGKHKPDSKHYIGQAIDCRIYNLNNIDPQIVRDEIAERLGNEFDVVLEKTHIHIEWDPD